MAVIGKAQLKCDLREIGIAADQVQGACQPQAQLIPVERHTFHALEDLGQVNRSHADLGGHFVQRPAP